jgi:osmotically inducible protein OsmC
MRISRLPTETSPEELLAAAHAACFANSLATELTRRRTPPGRLNVRATVVLDEVEDVGHRIVESQVVVRAAVAGIDADGFEAVVADADAGCTFSALVRASGQVTVDASLEEGS